MKIKLFSSSTPNWEEMFSERRAQEDFEESSTLDLDVDECVEDDYSEQDQE